MTVLCKSIKVSNLEITNCNLPLSHILKLKGMPMKFDFKDDYKVDWDVISFYTMTYDPEINEYTYYWEYK